MSSKPIQSILKKNFILEITIILIIFSFSTLIIPIQTASAIIDVGWDFSTGHNLGDGATPLGSVPNLFNVTDDGTEPNGVFNTTKVTITSITPGGAIKDSITMTLFEVDNPNPPPFGLNPDANTGIFVPTNIVFNADTARFSIGQSATITQQDAAFAGNHNLDAISLQVNSTSTPTGIQYFLKESSLDNGIFTGHLQFSSGPSIANSTIHVSPGDIVTISYAGIPSNVAIVPSLDGSVNGIKADVGDIIRVSYKGHTADTVICTCGGPGGGGGGLIRPSLVLDVIAGTIGGSPYVVSPPSFGGSFSDGLTLTQGHTKTTFDTSKFNQEIPNQVMVKGEPVNMKLKTFEAYKKDGVIGMTLFFIPRGKDMNMDVGNSIASIEWKNGKPVDIDDSNHILSDVKATSDNDGKFQYTQFSFTPTKSYDKMSFLVRAWNDHRYTATMRVHDAVDVVQPQKTLPLGVVKYENLADLQDTLYHDKFYKPEIMAHIHDTNAVFPELQGKVYWLYDTNEHSVTLVISDSEDNELFAHKGLLQPYEIEKRGDYGFMNFTTVQLNRQNVDQIQKALESEAEKAKDTLLDMKVIRTSKW